MDEFLSELEPGEFDEWNAAYLLDPWGPERLDAAIARLAILVEGLVREKPQYDFSDFVPRPGPFDHDASPGQSQVQQTAEEQAEILARRFRR